MHLGAVAASGLACLLEIVGVATPSWLSGTGGNMGLWKVCTDTILSNTCITLTDKPGRLFHVHIRIEVRVWCAGEPCVRSKVFLKASP